MVWSRKASFKQEAVSYVETAYVCIEMDLLKLDSSILNRVQSMDKVMLFLLKMIQSTMESLIMDIIMAMENFLDSERIFCTKDNSSIIFQMVRGFKFAKNTHL